MSPGAIDPIPVTALRPQALLAPAPDDFVIYILSVGDGDAIVLQFPEENGHREFAVIDSNDRQKTLSLLSTLGAGALRLVCATHPHIDHIRGLRDILRAFKGKVGEYWDSGFRFTSNTFHDLLSEVEVQGVRFIRPTSGYETFISGVRLSVLSPSIALRNRYDSYGVDVNNASIVVKVEYPSESVIAAARRADAPPPDQPSDEAALKPRSVILGGDAQTDAWSKVLEEFPHLDRSEENWARLIKARQGRQPLFCEVLKVSHHASKHGINLELVERMGDASGDGRTQGPKYLVNSCAAVSVHGFPHAVAAEIMREVRQPISKSGAARKRDHELGIHYTAQQIDTGGQMSAAGSVAVVLHKSGGPPDLYRLCDRESEPVDFTKARRLK